jgi:hypothetical protein
VGDHLLFYDAPGAQTPAPRKRRFARVLPTVLALALVAAGAIGYLNLQRLLDQYTAWTFSPSAAVESIVTTSGMTADGRLLFLASKPVIEPTSVFNRSCAEEQEGSGILGCYLPGDRTIHLFDVTDPRLTGLTDVVAAHEMLHAAWDRMNTLERQQLIPLLEARAAALAGDAAFQERMAYYAKNEPGQRDNELHSILGTEIASLGPALEEHYSRYFTDRHAIVALQAKSDAVFTDLENRSIALSTAMTATQTQIDSEYAAYTAGYSRLNADVLAFNARTNWTSQAQIDRAQSALRSRRGALDAQYADILVKTDDYNSKYSELSELIKQTAGLNKALNHGETLQAPAQVSGPGG